MKKLGILTGLTGLPGALFIAITHQERHGHRRLGIDHLLVGRLDLAPGTGLAQGRARKATITLKELPKLPVALREQGSGTLTALRHSLAARGIKLSELNSPIRLSGTEALKNFVMADECIGFLPLRSVEKEIASGSLFRLVVKGLSVWRQFYFIQRHGDAKSGLSQAFVRLAKNHYNVG